MAKNRKKFTLYLDESGMPEFTSITGSTRSRNFIISAITTDDLEDRNLSGYFEYLKRRHGLTMGTPFHSYDVFENTKSDCYLTPPKARSLVKSLIEFFKLTPLNFRVFYVDKEEVRSYFGINPKLRGKDYSDYDGSAINSVNYSICAANAFRWFSDKVLAKNDRGAIIAESRDRSDKSLIDAFLDCKDAGMYAQAKKMKHQRKCDKELKRMAKLMKIQLTSLKFETKSGECPGLEIADLVSYLTYLNLEGKIDAFRNKNISKLWNLIKRKMQGRKPHKITGRKCSETLSRNRVHKITNFAHKTKNIGNN